MKKYKASETHAKAEAAREHEQDFKKAIRLSKLAAKQYQNEKDCKGLSEIYGSLTITYKHLFSKYQSEKYRLMAQKYAKKAVLVSENCVDKTSRALAYFNYADYIDTVESNYTIASKYYKKALDFMRKYPPQSHKDSGVDLSIAVHLYACEYRNGDETAIDKLISTAGKIEDSKISQYEKDVWSSGAYMKAGYLLWKSDRRRSVKCLQKARNIIYSNKDLVLRKQQFDKLSSELDNE